ncbi:hypothetical protein K7H94_22830 (plasmid) [Pantoea dispersa]|uniref:hypothetical protein n=1 Tax=Pantoea dispersa TaxID=59814 RepID=UPI001CA641D2|nr:hypothetical protein [Pantoea dispersa]QZY92972.1 hypothetical protein K7H94_22830 [Pantoea dispersa]
MTQTEIGVLSLIGVLAGGGLINLVNFLLESSRGSKEVPPEEQPLRRNDLENAEQDYHAMLQRLGVTDRWFRHAWPLTQISLMWSGPPGSLTSGIPAALRAAAGELSKNGAGNFSCDCLTEAGGGARPDVAHRFKSHRNGTVNFYRRTRQQNPPGGVAARI